MSGGVDSSVSAALLKEGGFDVVGVFMKPWQDPLVHCLWQKDREDALRVAAVLNIPLLTWDFSKEYGTKVTQAMIRGYRKGVTPNPDVLCNKEIKFGLFFKKALKEGADFVATGHYARVGQDKKDYYFLRKAVDADKDQTYFLWTLGQTQLSKTLFPVGEYRKSKVRQLAKRFQLPTFDKKDSQGICFVGDLNIKQFLKLHIPSRNGPIIHLNGQILGQHDGAAYYTIGQRHGLNIGVGGGPYFVVRKDMRKNIIYVGTESDLFNRTANVGPMHWISSKIKLPANLKVKIRYRTPAVSVTFGKKGDLHFLKPQRAITSGQSAVFYLGQQVVGGATIN